MTTNRQQNAGFHALTAQALAEFVFLYDIRTGRVEFSTDTLAAALGYESDDAAVSSGPLTLMSDEDAMAVMADITTAASRLVPVPARTVGLRRSNGQTGEFRLHYCIRPVGVAGDADTQWFVFVRCATNAGMEGADPDELRRLRRESESILQFGTFDYDILNDAGHWSDGLFSIFGYQEGPRPAVSYQLLRNHVNGELRQEPLQTSTGGQTPAPREYSVDYNITDAGGRQKTLRVTGRILFDHLGIAVRDIGLMMDITNQRTQLSTISKYIDELKRSNRGLEEFAYVASHDLQEPLRKISTFSGRLAVRYGHQLEKEGAVYLERIIAAADSMRHLMDNLLEFSRLSTINQPTTQTNLNFIVQQVRQELELRIDETGTRLVSEKLPVIEAAPTQMKQLFTNIINNAIKFAKPGIPPEITLTTTHEFSSQERLDYGLLEGLGYYKVCIQDNGIGFENEYAERIFQIFQRLHGKAEYPGSGIGLAICRKIVEGHHGLIFAENVPHAGARFTIILPEKQP